ncbi:MAG: hypothetical protein ACR2NP_18675 [Pirellulaceae bacterium]
MVWNRLLFAIVLLGCWCCSHSLPAQSLWSFDVDDALQSVGDKTRILIVVQFHSNFLKSPRGSRELELFEQVALDERTREWLSENAVLVAQNVGQSDVLQLQPPGAVDEEEPAVNASSRDPDPGQCVTWFCNTDNQVLFCLAGYPDAGEFYRRARWTHLAAVRFAENDHSFRSEYHARQIHALDRVLFHETLDKVRRDDEQTKTRNSDLEQAVEALSRVRRKRLQDRFGGAMTDGGFVPTNALLTQHAAFESDLMHILLAYEPVPVRHAMERAFWQRICGLRMWSTDQPELIAWAEYQTRRRRPLMLRVIDEFTIDDRWPPDSPVRLGRLLDEFAEREVSLDDIAVIAAHHDFSEIVIPPDVRPMYLAATSRGDSWKLHTNSDTLADLTRTLGKIESLQRQRNRRRR